VDWHARDLTLKAAIEALTETLVASGSSERRSAYRLLRLLRAQNLMIRSRHKLPNSYDALVECVETEAMWRDRRLKLAATHLEAIGEPLTVARLSKLANINWTYRDWIRDWVTAFTRSDDSVTP